MSNSPFLLAAFLLSFPLSVSAQTKEETLIESHWGIAAGTGWIQDYPGAGQGRMRYLVMPTFKGKYLTIDRQDGVKGELIDENRIKFAMSFSFLFPTASSRIPVREGMPSLDWVFQLGPELQVFLYKSPRQTIYVRLPLRFVATTDFKERFQYRDWNFAPGLRSNYLLNGWGEIMTRAELNYASEAFSDLFYEVDSKYATASRPTYNAQSGLMDYIFGINYSYNEAFPWGFSIGTNVYLTGPSANHDSPLLERNTNYSILGSVVRYF